MEIRNAPRNPISPVRSPSPSVLILTVAHGAGHQRLAHALSRALLDIQPDLAVHTVNATEHCTRWFKLYYDSYLIPLKYWPGLWGWIEGVQHAHQSTTPAWLCRRGAQPLFRLIRELDPDVVIATEVGTCELAAMLKRENHARFGLVAAPGLDIDRAWAQPEVDLYLGGPDESVAQLVSAGAPAARILTCGLPIDPVFASLRDRMNVRSRLRLDPATPLLLVLFGGTGHGKPSRMLPALKRLPYPINIVCITGMNPRLEDKLRRECRGDERFRVLGWVSNVHEWMVAADLLVSKPGENTVSEAIACRLPILAFDPLPGAEQRTCQLIEQWKVGCWVRRPEHLGPSISRLLNNPDALRYLREQARRLARPGAAHAAAEAIVSLNVHPCLSARSGIKGSDGGEGGVHFGD